jgi:hypothetical protein
MWTVDSLSLFGYPEFNVREELHAIPLELLKSGTLKVLKRLMWIVDSLHFSAIQEFSLQEEHHAISLELPKSGVPKSQNLLLSRPFSSRFQPEVTRRTPLAGLGT